LTQILGQLCEFQVYAVSDGDDGGGRGTGSKAAAAARL
jgi:hypothetical protein